MTKSTDDQKLEVARKMFGADLIDGLLAALDGTNEILDHLGIESKEIDADSFAVVPTQRRRPPVVKQRQPLGEFLNWTTTQPQAGRSQKERTQQLWHPDELSNYLLGRRGRA